MLCVFKGLFTLRLRDLSRLVVLLKKDLRSCIGELLVHCLSHLFGWLFLTFVVNSIYRSYKLRRPRELVLKELFLCGLLTHFTQLYHKLPHTGTLRCRINRCLAFLLL
jgi:hypothetical protein